jgi:hypothetical protein
MLATLAGVGAVATSLQMIAVEKDIDGIVAVAAVDKVDEAAVLGIGLAQGEGAVFV